MSRRDSFIQGLVENAGWDKEWAEAHFMHFAPMFEIGNEIDFVLSEAMRLQLNYLARLTKRNANFQVYLLSNRASAPNKTIVPMGSLRLTHPT